MVVSAAKGLWRGCARALGGLARSMGGDAQAKDPEVRRDGVGLGLFGLALLVAAGFWLTIPGLIGGGLRIGVSWLVGRTS